MYFQLKSTTFAKSKFEKLKNFPSPSDINGIFLNLKNNQNSRTCFIVPHNQIEVIKIKSQLPKLIYMLSKIFKYHNVEKSN